jgi:hypothetical protein
VRLARSLVIVAVTACTAARIDARASPGLQLGLSGGLFHPMPGEPSASASGGFQNTNYAVLGLLVGYGVRVSGDAVAAIALKVDLWAVPYTLPIPTGIDFYLQAVRHEHFIAGFGAELGLLPSLYGVVTYAPWPAFFVTLTGRLRWSPISRAQGLFATIQLAAGVRIEGRTSVGLYVSYTQASPWMDINASDYDSSADGYVPMPILRRDFLQSGLAVSF